MPIETVISVSGLKKSYKDLQVIKGIDFHVQKSTIFALLGSNGAGKTTTVRILATLLKPDHGDAQICSFDVVRQAELVRGEISLTGQYAAVDEIMTGRENLRMMGQLRHLPDAKQKANELLERFGLTEAADRRVATYSGGMRRRLDLAMSLVGNPSIIFLDEPTTGLDPQTRLTMWKMIKNLTLTGVTVFLTTQYLEEAEQLADQIAILNQGRIVAEGTPGQLKKLLPGGLIQLGFEDKKQLQDAHQLLQAEGDDPQLNEDNMTLTIATDGSVRAMSCILRSLDQADVPVVTFSQKLPTLEDVFLSIIGDKEDKADAADCKNQVFPQ